MLTNNNIGHLIECSYKIRLSVLKILTKSGIGYLGACLAMADIFTTLYFGLLKEVSNGLDSGNTGSVFLVADHLEPLQYASRAHAGLIPLKALYPDLSLISIKKPSIASKENRFLHTLSLVRSFIAKFNKTKVFVIICIEDLLKEENLFRLMDDYCSTQGYIIFILDHSGLYLNENESAANIMVNLKDKFTISGWNSRECDGHNYNDICSAFVGSDNEKPLIILPHTISGKGIISIENDPDWYSKVPSEKEAREFCCQLEESFRINKMRWQTYKASENSPEG